MDPNPHPVVHITGAGTPEINGDYFYIDTFNGHPRYHKQISPDKGYWIRFSGIWYICDGKDVETAKKFFYYFSIKDQSAAEVPVNVNWECEVDGRKPAPIVSQFVNGEVIETKVLGTKEELWVFCSITKMHRDGTFDLFVLNHQKHRVHPEALFVDPNLCRKRTPDTENTQEPQVYDIFLCFGFDSESDIAKITFSKQTNGGELRALLGERFEKDLANVHLIKDGKKLEDNSVIEDKDRVVVVFGSGGDFSWS